MMNLMIFQVLKTPYEGSFVDVGPGWNLDEVKIRTITLIPENLNSNKEPLLLVHGFGSGICHWLGNLDSLAQGLGGRKIYAIDLLGFARSSRPSFDLDGEVEIQFVESIERWRDSLNIKKFIICGHSFGGYISSCYALFYPEHIKHLILADPWGIDDRDLKSREDSVKLYPIPPYITLAQSLANYFPPLSILRGSGPYGKSLVHRFKSEIGLKFVPFLGDQSTIILDYIYHCNAQTPSGELAFKSLTSTLASAKRPMIHRLVDLDDQIPITFIYGGRSWIDNSPGWFLKDCLAPERVEMKVIYGAGHHVNVDDYETFNLMVIDACNKIWPLLRES